jgi:hypothetical protein
MGTPKKNIFKINHRSGYFGPDKLHPEGAFVAVPYNRRWFWIDNKDLPSKQVFSFLMFTFTLVETRNTEGKPLITIPVR